MPTADETHSRAFPDPAAGLPRHIAVIMDGNGRWATARGLPRISGHRRGAESVRAIIRGCRKRGIPYLTLFAFSSENWQRPPREVKLLMELFVTVLEKEIDALVDNGIRLRIIGETQRFGRRIVKLISKAEQRTADNTEMLLTIAANYGGRWDITQACRRLAAQVADGTLAAEQLDEDRVADQLATTGMPDPDLFIRTGGEQRISNFLMWQLAYTELYFTEALWPEFRDDDLEAAIQSFITRERRYGRTSEQLDRAGHV